MKKKLNWHFFNLRFFIKIAKKNAESAIFHIILLSKCRIGKFFIPLYAKSTFFSLFFYEHLPIQHFFHKNSK
jgi:hypothetical protein